MRHFVREQNSADRHEPPPIHRSLGVPIQIVVALGWADELNRLSKA
jgi:hypothetical protein